MSAHPHPGMKLILEAIPAELKSRRQWVLWCGEDRVDRRGEKKLTKIPYATSGYPASHSNSETWDTFTRCVEALPLLLEAWEAENPQSFRGGGLGYVFTAEDPDSGIDLDKVRDPTAGTLAPWAQHLVGYLDSYTEVSPSGTGVKIFCQARLPGRGVKKDKLEIYDRFRFFTTTGEHLAGTPATLEPRQRQVEALYKVHAIVDQALRRHGERFSLLFAGQWQQATDRSGNQFPSQSEADQSFCALAASVGATDPQVLDTLVRISGLYREKWDRVDYRANTMAKALRQAQFYDGQHVNGSRSHASSDEAPPRAPDPLRRELPPPEPYPIEALGPCLAAMTHKLMSVVQAPDALCAQAVLGGATLAIQAHRDVTLDGRQYPLSEYYLTLGESGERKTATDARALWPHRQREYELVLRHAEENQRFENERDAYKKSREEILRKEKTHTARKTALELLGPPPVSPLKPLLTASEPTYEGLVRLLSEGQPSLGLFSNEGGRLIGGYGMTTDHQLKTAAGLSELWDGQRIDRVRGGDGATALYGRRLSMHLMMQPSIAHLLLGNGLLLEQGLLSRCLVAWPETKAGQRLYKPTDLTHDSDVLRYNAVIQNFLQRDLPLAEGKRNELHPPALTLTQDAKVMWIAFHDHVEEQIAPEGELAPVRSFASKAAEHVLRLAGVLSVVENPEALQIGKDAIVSAITLVQFYLTEALRLFGAEGTDPDLLLAEKLLVWVQNRGAVCLPDIYQKGPNRVRDAKTARRLVNILEEHGWLLRVQGGMELNGVFRQEVWRVYQ